MSDSDPFEPWQEQIEFCAAIVARESPSCSKKTESIVSSSLLLPCAIAEARAEIVKFSEQPSVFIASFP
ncbi:MAG: hypothetical protein LIO62_02855 [Clostridiales bacterium]|nr:hypothetical protein [Clostridiales bacterium]